MSLFPRAGPTGSGSASHLAGPPVLTRQGAAVTVASVAMVVAGRLFAVVELFVLGAGGAALVIGAALFVGLTRVHLDVVRELRPTRVHAGQPATVQLRVHNRGARRAPVLSLCDVVEGIKGTARVVLAPLAPGQTVTATYTVPSDRRGVLAIGPMEVRLADPFGLTSVSSPGAPVSLLSVWPAVEQVLAFPPSTPGDHRDADAEPTGALAHQGDEFYALRPYADGDDRRHVHWRASAKRDELVVRQHERRAPGRATVVLDTTAGAYQGDTFERAVSAAASIALACSRGRLPVRVMTTAGFDSGFGGDARHLDRVMEHLAVVQLRQLGHLPTLLGALRRPGPGHGQPVAVLTGSSAGGGGTGGAGAQGLTVVAFATGHHPTPARGATVVVDDTTTFSAAWNRVMVPSRRPVAPTGHAART